MRFIVSKAFNLSKDSAQTDLKEKGRKRISATDKNAVSFNRQPQDPIGVTARNLQSRLDQQVCNAMQ